MNNISNFRMPDFHPFGLLEAKGKKSVTEQEQALCYILGECVKAGNWIPVKTARDHSDLVEQGYLQEAVGTNTYFLTEKARRALHEFFGA